MGINAFTTARCRPYFFPIFSFAIHNGGAGFSLLHTHHLLRSAAMTILNQLVAEEKFPIATALYVADGTVYVFADDFHHNQLTLTKTTTIDAMDVTDWVAHYWATPQLESYQGTVYCGEGSWGSDGVVYFADRDDEVQWLFASPVINPITYAVVTQNHVIAANEGLAFAIPISKPENIRLLTLEQ